MRIVCVGTAYPLRGGIAQFNTALVRKLRERGHVVDVITFTRQYPGLLFPGKSQKEQGPPDPDLDVGAEPIVDSIGPISWRRAYNRIRALDPDLVFYKYWMPYFAPCFGTISRWVHKGTRARVVYICDNVVPHERRPLDGALTRYLLGSGDGFVVMSRAVERDLRAFRPDAPSVLAPHPIYDHFGEPIPKAEARRRAAAKGVSLATGDRPLILFFGIIRPYKGLDLLLRAMPDIVKHTGAGLIVAGEFYSGRDETLALVRELNLGEHVHMVDGYVSTEDVALYMSASDVVVLPYRSATQSGIVQVAYQLECPVIATDVGGLSEMIHDGDTGLLIPPADPVAVATAVRRYYDEGLEPAMREAVRREKARYSWDHFAEAFEGLAARCGATEGS